MIAVILLIFSHNGHFGSIASVQVFKEPGICEVVKKAIDDENYTGIKTKCVRINK